MNFNLLLTIIFTQLPFALGAAISGSAELRLELRLQVQDAVKLVEQVCDLIYAATY